MTRNLLTKAAIVIGLSLSAQSATAMDNPGAEVRATIAAALGKADATAHTRSTKRQTGISFSADRMLDRYELAQKRIRAAQPHPNGGR